MKVLMIVGDFVEDYEVMVPFQALESVGVTVDVVCPEKRAGDKVATAVHDFTEFQTYIELRGHNFVLNKDFDAVNVDDYAGLYIPGGRMAEYVRLNKRVLEITKHFFDKNLPVACVCHGAQILAAAGVCKGRTLTCYAAVGPDVTLVGGHYKDVPATETVVDGNLLTSPAWPGHQTILKHFYRLLGIKITHQE